MGECELSKEIKEISEKCYEEILKLKIVHTLGINVRKVEPRIKSSGQTYKGDEAPLPIGEEIED